MAIADSVLFKNDDLPIRVAEPVHSGKVRSVYWLTPEDSRRLIDTQGYDVAPDARLAVMVISDRISAFDCIWRAEGGLDGVPKKGAALNAISKKWFDLFQRAGLADNHIVDTPHPLVWIVQRAQPVLIEAIVRGYITGSMWRSYEKGERSICGIPLPDGLRRDQKLPAPLLTPSTKGVIRGVPGIPEADDVNITREDIINNLQVFRFDNGDDVSTYERLLTEGFELISDELAKIGQIFVDTKFEFGYATGRDGVRRLIYIDEVGTPDSSRIWDAKAYAEGRIIERSKEGFRKLLLANVPDADVLLNKDRMPERFELARGTRLPQDVMLEVSSTYASIAEEILGAALPRVDNPRQEITDVLSERYGIIA